MSHLARMRAPRLPEQLPKFYSYSHQQSISFIEIRQLVTASRHFRSVGAFSQLVKKVHLDRSLAVVPSCFLMPINIRRLRLSASASCTISRLAAARLPSDATASRDGGPGRGSGSAHGCECVRGVGGRPVRGRNAAVSTPAGNCPFSSMRLPIIADSRRLTRWRMRRKAHPGFPILGNFQHRSGNARNRQAG